jgi:hypothetical protein
MMLCNYTTSASIVVVADDAPALKKAIGGDDDPSPSDGGGGISIDRPPIDVAIGRRRRHQRRIDRTSAWITCVIL